MALIMKENFGWSSRSLEKELLSRMSCECTLKQTMKYLWRSHVDEALCQSGVTLQ